MTCPVCRYNQVKDIDRALLSGASLSQLSQIYGLSLEALQKHQEHLLHKIRLAQTQVHNSILQSCLFNLSRLLELVMHTARLAKGEGNFPISLQASREVTRIVALMAKLNFQLDPGMVHCLLDNHDWVGNGALLPYASEVIPQTRHYMSTTLFSPCPESEAAPQTGTAAGPPAAAQNDFREKPFVEPKSQREVSAKLARN